MRGHRLFEAEELDGLPAPSADQALPPALAAGRPDGLPGRSLGSVGPKVVLPRAAAEPRPRMSGAAAAQKRPPRLARVRPRPRAARLELVRQRLSSGGSPTLRCAIAWASTQSANAGVARGAAAGGGTCAHRRPRRVLRHRSRSRPSCRSRQRRGQPRSAPSSYVRPGVFSKPPAFCQPGLELALEQHVADHPTCRPRRSRAGIGRARLSSRRGRDSRVRAAGNPPHTASSAAPPSTRSLNGRPSRRGRLRRALLAILAAADVIEQISRSPERADRRSRRAVASSSCPRRPAPPGEHGQLLRSA